MITAILSVLLLLSLWSFAYLFYRYLWLKDAIKNFNPIVNTTVNNIRYIGEIRNWTDNDDKALSINKEILKQLLRKVQFRISEYTKILHSSYRVTGYHGDSPIFWIKSDSEKWLEHGRMSGYDDIESDIRHLIAIEEVTT